MKYLLFSSFFLLFIGINVESTTTTYNPINRMDARVRDLERHFFVDTPISILEKYFNEFGETILTLDASLVKLILGIPGDPSINDVRAAVTKYFEDDSNRNEYTLIRMDEEIKNLQDRLSALESRVTNLEDNDFDATLFLLIKQIQCELSTLKDGPRDCRVSKCQPSNTDIPKLLAALSPAKKTCPAGFDEDDVNLAAKSMIGELNNNKFHGYDDNNNNNNYYNNKHYEEFNNLQNQLSVLYSIVGFLFGCNLIGFCCIFYSKRKQFYQPIKIDDESNQL